MLSRCRSRRWVVALTCPLWFLSPPGFSSCLSPPLSHVLPQGRGWHPVGPSRHTPPGTVKAKAARLALSFSWESQLLRKVTGVCSRKGVFIVGSGTMLGSIPSVQGAPWCWLLTAPGTSRIERAAGWDRLAAQTVWPRGVRRGVRQLREHIPSCKHHSLRYERHSAGPGPPTSHHSAHGAPTRPGWRSRLWRLTHSPSCSPAFLPLKKTSDFCGPRSLLGPA